MSESFADRWAHKESELELQAIAAKMVACGSSVLPDSAAPCVTFDKASRPAPIWEVFGSPADWSSADRERLAQYRMIGSDGAGNPICVEQTTGSVIVLNHEDGFRSRQFVNSSVPQLAECLLAYMGELGAERFRLAVAQLDAAAIEEGAFWFCEANNLG